MARITSLTKEQEELMSVIRDEWIEIAFETSPLDKNKAEAAINLIYEIEGENKPQQIIWFNNPLDAVVLILNNIKELFPAIDSTRYIFCIPLRVHWKNTLNGLFRDV